MAHDDIRLAETIWAVHRQDDNGNAFLVERGLTRDHALQAVAEFESHGHKQLYWIAPDHSGQSPASQTAQAPHTSSINDRLSAGDTGIR